MSAKNVELREISPDEFGGHQPPEGAEESWQESWGFAWHDPKRRAGGINHISIWRRRGVADVWSWVALDGQVVGKYQNLNLPLPDEDFPNWALGGQRVTTESGRRCRLQLSYDTAEADLNYESHTAPLAFPLNVDGSTWGDSHYESIGRINGTVSAGGAEPVAVSGFAWQDHSWGPRRWADTLSHRWIMASFGPELFMSVLTVITEAGPEAVPMGFVFERGDLHFLDRITFGTRIADDGHSPAGCDAEIWTKAGHGYHVTGQVHTASPSSHVEGFWFTDGLATFECGGLLGAGILEVQDLKGPAPWHREVLGLDLPEAVPALA
jgi:hypothetical protein